MVAHFTLRQIAAGMGGKISGKEVLCPGPNHSPKDASLAIALSDTELGVVFKSFAGDSFDACADHFRKRMGLPNFEPNGKSNGRHARTAAPKEQRKPKLDSRMDAVFAAHAKAEAAAEPAVIYPYDDESGKLLYEVLRFEPKDFRQRAADGSWNLDGVKRVLYRLPELLSFPDATIFFCEGEKDADRLASLGHCTTTISGGTKWNAPGLIEPLRGRDVVIVPDHDAAGRRKAWEAASALHGVAASVRMVTLPGLTGGAGDKDISDWLDADRSRTDDFERVCLKAPLWTPTEPEPPIVEALKPDNQDHAAIEPLIVRDAGDERPLPPPRGWLLGNIFARRFVSSLIAEGGVGKTAMRMGQILSSATGRSLLGDHVFQRCRVLIVCLEDDDDELERRLVAARLHFGIERSELKGWLFTSAPGIAAGKIMTLDPHGRPVIGNFVAKLDRLIVEKKIDLVCLDPFVKTHSVPENDNVLIDHVVQVLTDLAVKYDIAVDTPHHTSKGPADPGNASRGRGASASKDAWRIVQSLAPMTTDEANAFGITEAERRRLLRMDPAKINIAPAIEARWFKLVSVAIGNATDMYPNGDDVQTVERWTPPDAFLGLNGLALNQILNDIDAGLPDGNRYSNAPKAGDRAAWRAIVNRYPDKTEAAAKSIIKAWIISKLLVFETYLNPTTRKEVKGLRVDPEKRPS